MDLFTSGQNPLGQTTFLNTLRYKAISITALVDWRMGGFAADMTKNLWDEGGNSRDYDNASKDAALKLGEFRYNNFAAGNIAEYIDNGTANRISTVIQ